MTMLATDHPSALPTFIPKGADVAQMVYDASQRMAQVIADAETIEELADLRARWNAFCEMVEAKRKGGEAKAQATARRIELAIGEMILDWPVPPDSPLTKTEVWELRCMARYPEVVEAVIAASTNAAPATRNRCIQAVRRRRIELADIAPGGRTRQRKDRRKTYKRGGDATAVAKAVGGNAAVLYALIRRALKAHEAMTDPANTYAHNSVGYHLVEAEAACVEMLQSERRDRLYHAPPETAMTRPPL